MSLAAPDCFCHCLGSFQECSCPRITTCEKCRRHCLDSNTGSPQKKKRKSLSLKDKENSNPRFSSLSKEDELDLQKAFVPSNTKRSTDWAVKVFFDWKKARICVCSSFVIILIFCLLTCLLSLAAAYSFLDLFTVSQSQL